MRTDFKYVFDPVFLFSLALYTLNKLSFSSSHYFGSEFFAFYLNDMLLIPVLLPTILFLSRIMNFRRDNYPPRLIEIAIPLSIWSIAFEWVGPHLFGKGSSDPLDVIAYSVGGLLCWLIWNRCNFLAIATLQK